MEFKAFLTSLGTSSILFVVLMLLFAWFSRKADNYVIYYLNWILKGLDPTESGKKTRNPFVWIREALSSSDSDVIRVSGVDSAVYFVFLTTGYGLDAPPKKLFLQRRSLKDGSDNYFFERARQSLGNVSRETRALSLSPGVSVWNALVLEIVMTFGLLYTVFATAVDPNKGNVGKIAPLAIGFIVGANILVGGAFDGGCMNPAAAFGPALVSWTWERHHWVYWVGPLIGGGLAGFVYDSIFLNHSYEKIPNDY